jgi:hypothetical protein
MKQTAIIVRVGDKEVLVRISGLHIASDLVSADTRDARVHDTWQPVELEVRREGEG